MVKQLKVARSKRYRTCVFLLGLALASCATTTKKEDRVTVGKDTESPFFQKTTEEVAHKTNKSYRQHGLTGLEISKNRDGEVAVIARVNGTTPSLSKTAVSEYTLRLPDTSFDAGTIRPVISGNKASAIRTVRAVADGRDTLIRIFVDPKVALKVKTEADKIVVTSSTDALALLEKDLMEVRAQNKASDVAEEQAPEAASFEKKEENAPKAAEVKEVDSFKRVAGGEDEFENLLADTPKYTGRLISLELQDTDIDNALRIIAEVSNLNIIASEEVQGKVTLRLVEVPWDQALDVILKTNRLDKVQEGNVIRIAPVDQLRTERESLKQARLAEEELEPLQVKFLRVSYARAAELKPLVDSVITERGAVTFDERTNQLIIKDIGRGIKNVVNLVQKLDLRTPQILLETQIVEAQRTLLRELGAEVGFQLVQDPALGNGTGANFPSLVDFGGAIRNNQPQNLNPISLLFGSADGTKSLSARLTSLETEGQVRIVSRPAVATTNNKQAIIKSVEKVRVRLPQGGVSVATGQGANAAGQGSAATETIEIGIVLEVTPQASPDYYVLLDINAKSSTFSAEETDGIPNEVERSATSSVLVSSGQTFALGGVYKITDRDSVSGVPFFKDIPFLGHLFRYVSTDKEDEELLFFITPRVVEGSFDDSAMKSS